MADQTARQRVRRTALDAQARMWARRAEQERWRDALGMVVVSAGGGVTLDTLDVAAKSTITRDGTLEAYHSLWQSAEHEELVPAKGCSIPTFHGSAADMAAVSAEIVNLVAPHYEARVSGVHLFALPHSGSAPAHAFITAETMGIALHPEPSNAP